MISNHIKIRVSEETFEDIGAILPITSHNMGIRILSRQESMLVVHQSAYSMIEAVLITRQLVTYTEVTFHHQHLSMYPNTIYANGGVTMSRIEKVTESYESLISARDYGAFASIKKGGEVEFDTLESLISQYTQ